MSADGGGPPSGGDDASGPEGSGPDGADTGPPADGSDEVTDAETAGLEAAYAAESALDNAIWGDEGVEGEVPPEYAGLVNDVATEDIGGAEVDPGPSDDDTWEPAGYAQTVDDAHAFFDTWAAPGDKEAAEERDAFLDDLDSWA